MVNVAPTILAAENARKLFISAILDENLDPEKDPNAFVVVGSKLANARELSEGPTLINEIFFGEDWSTDSVNATKNLQVSKALEIAQLRETLLPYSVHKVAKFLTGLGIIATGSLLLRHTQELREAAEKLVGAGVNLECRFFLGTLAPGISECIQNLIAAREQQWLDATTDAQKLAACSLCPTDEKQLLGNNPRTEEIPAGAYWVDMVDKCKVGIGLSGALRRGQESGADPIIIAMFPLQFAGLGGGGHNDGKCNYRATWVAQATEVRLTFFLNGGLPQGQVHGSQATVNNLGAGAEAGGTASGVEAKKAADFVRGIREADPVLLQELLEAADRLEQEMKVEAKINGAASKKLHTKLFRHQDFFMKFFLRIRSRQRGGFSGSLEHAPRVIDAQDKLLLHCALPVPTGTLALAAHTAKKERLEQELAAAKAKAERINGSRVQGGESLHPQKNNSLSLSHSHSLFFFQGPLISSHN
jgi:hypothetical protein